ncbi:MAG TPA: hypothetical protein VHM90_11630, partial [Phycisphaerae bacterium]|nr:hypothetical protein [Phycisphaerae bacterium]
MGILILASALVLLYLCSVLLRRPFRRRWLARGAGVVLLLPALSASIAGGYWTWFTHRLQPAPARAPWFRGIVYERIVLQSPRPVVLHLVRIDLLTPGVEIVLTPVSAATRRPLKAATVSRFARESGAQ